MLKSFATFKRLYYFDGPTKLFSELYLAKFLDTSAKSFFSCVLKLIIYIPCLKNVYVIIYKM